VFRGTLNTLFKGALAGLALAATSSQAASVSPVYLDFTLPGADKGTLNAPALYFDQQPAPVVVRGFKEQYNSYYDVDFLQNSLVIQTGAYGDGGLGICDTYAGCSAPLHAIDNYNEDGYSEVVSFEFDQTVQFNSITIYALTEDFELGYSTSNAGDPAYPGYLDIAGRTLTGTDQYSLHNIGFTELNEINDVSQIIADHGDGVYTLLLEGSGNALLLGATEGLAKFKVLGLEVTPVPVPAAAWLFASALGLLAGVRRKQ